MGFLEGEYLSSPALHRQAMSDEAHIQHVRMCRSYSHTIVDLYTIRLEVPLYVVVGAT